ncbi:multiple epidermal growth factor-like domains protein 10 [Haliotis asinina]|uniref:multiple epidermal growth factor-like domains protein 10 n=1 Tax=Haliotis asinina TaxID=109174 RepID=UPI00353188B5
MKAFFILFVSACILVKVVSGFSKDDAKCQDTHSWCKTVNCDSPGIADSCPMTCGRCNSTVNCEGGQYWNGSTCTECWDGMPSEYRGKCPCANTGRWGVNCQHRCNKWCLDGICDPLSGECANCPRNRYSKMCDKTCDECGNCTEASPNCNRTSGTCLCGCSPGFYGRTCGEQCYNCRFKVCNSSGFCVHGCKEGYFGSQCDKECGECVDKSCSRMGECLNGCHSGWHGKECTSSCSSNCKDSNCHQNGTCMKCLDGFHGDQCLSCRKGFRGAYCNTSCPRHCVECDQNASNCTSCEYGYFGSTCEEKCNGCVNGSCNITDGFCMDGCKPRLYGRECQSNCSSNCLKQNAVPLCSRGNGTCTNGCYSGWFKAKCDVPCPQGCKGKSCKRDTGICIHGCTHALYGPHCNQSCHCLMSPCIVTGTCTGCLKGYYGERCSSTCPPRCDTCEQHTGECITCVEGWRGHMCNESYVRSLRQLVSILSSCIGVVLSSAIVVAAFIIIRKKCSGWPRGIYLTPVRTDHHVWDDISLQELSENGESEQSHYETIPDSQAGYEALSPSTSHTSGYTTLLQSAETARVTVD